MSMGMGLGLGLGRRLRWQAATIVAALSITGCGGGNDPTPAAPVTVAQPGDATAAPGAGDAGSAAGGGLVVGASLANSAVCDGVDLGALKSRVYVSESGSDDFLCGQRTDHACRTIEQGLSACIGNGAGCGVVVRHGLYPAARTLRLVEGVAIQAGCRFDGESDRHYRSVIQMAAGVTQGINATGIQNLTVVRGLVVVGSDSPPSTANIGVVAEASPGLSIQQTLVIAGKGGNGLDPGAPDGGPGETGVASSNQQEGGGAGGGRACPSNTPAPFAYGHGGQGGDGMEGNASPCNGYACSCRISNQSSIGGKDGAGTAKGPTAGGSGGDNGAKPSEACVFPAYGPDFYGRAGQGGAGGRCAATGGTRASDVWGAFAAGVWSPSSGTAGAPGDTGAGGGGGSSGGFCIQLGGLFNLGVDHFVYGVPGGGGGGGGCGGGDGRGGVQGGVSIALLVKNMPADRLMDGNGWVAGVGGQGARGGTGGAGGAGGRGGARGGGLFTSISNVNGMAVACPAPSGAGGDGGQGGAGSGGGAGNGGPSIGVALTGGAALPAAQNGIYVGAPGLGGAAGAGGAGSNCTGGGGEAGIGGAAGAVVNVDSLPPNVLAAGDALESGQSRVSPNGNHRLTMQADGNLCFYRNYSFSWCSQQSYQASGVRLTMGTDGNLCLRDSSGYGTWCTNSTVGHTGAYLAVRDDGSVAVLDGSVPLVTLP